MNQESLKVLVFDDEPTRGWETRIRQTLDDLGIVPDVDLVELSQFGEEFDRLSKAAEVGADEPYQGILDTADVIVVDSDINVADPRAPGLRGKSGQRFVELARHFTSVSTTIVVNQADDKPALDLRLTQFTDSAADFHVDGKSIGDPAFWSGVEPSQGGYRPWNWTGVVGHVAAMKTLCEGGGDWDLEAPVSEQLDFEALGGQWTLAQSDAFSSAETGSVITLGQFAAQSFSDAAPAWEPTEDLESLTRIGLYALGRVVRRVLLPPLSVICDATHLLALAPSAVLGATTADAKNAVTDELRRRIHQFELPPLDGPLAMLAATPVWATEKLFERLEGSRLAPEAVLAEDSSTYIELQKARPFRHDLGGPLPLRYVTRDTTDLHLHPLTRLGRG